MKASFALAVLVVACARHEPAEKKRAPRVEATAAASAPAAPPSTASSAAPSAAPAASCSASEPSLPPLKLSDMKAGPPAVPLSASPGLWLADEHGALLSASPQASWAEGSVHVGADNTATRAVTVSKLPKPLRAWLGRRVKVLGASGAVCETRLQRFVIRAQITPDLRTAENWEGCAEGPPVSPETIASEVWRLTARSGRSLIAEFSAPCKGALLAVDPDLPAPSIAAPRPASAEEGEAALKALRQLPEYIAIQKRYQAEQPEAEGKWDDHEARRSVTVLALPGQESFTFVSVEVGTGCPGSRSFSAALSALTSPGLYALDAIDDRRTTPSAIVDLGEGAGARSIILLGPDGHFRARSALRPSALGGVRTFSSSVPFFPGPC